ncbi:MAG: MFS transporter [Akkermansia sp.]|nr:MFS transporter [Akkermansia sp.]
MSTDSPKAELPASVKRYAWYLMFMAGLGGLLYGIDVGVIAAALPYIEKTSTYTLGQLSSVVAAVLLGSVISSLFAGMLAEWLGRRKVIIISALLFTLSIPVICFSNNVYWMLMLGRILQGASAGLVGVVVPMYLAECLDAQSRGKGTGMFQFLLTVGLVFAAVVGIATTAWVGAATDVTVSLADKSMAWKTIFWCSALPGLILFIGAFKLKESPRWLYRRGREDEALISLAANNGEEAAKEILAEMKAADKAEEEQKAQMKEAAKGDSLFQRKYVIPFILAVVVLACTQATGINSVLNYSVKIFQQAGLEGETANIADLAIKVVNMLMTIVAVTLVDKKGRTFLLKMGTLGIIVGLAGVGAMFLSLESGRTDVTEYVQQQVKDDAYLKVSVEDAVRSANTAVAPGLQLIVTYQQGEDTNQIVNEHFDRAAAVAQVKEASALDYEDTAMGAVDVEAARKAYEESMKAEQADTVAEAKAETLSDKIRMGEIQVQWKDDAQQATTIKTIQQLESNGDRAIIAPAFAMNDQGVAEVQKLEIKRAEIGMKPTQMVGWFVTGFFVVFIAFYAAGPGVCVWLALSELMPTRIRANGMAIALLINQLVSTTIAGTFLPWVGAYGYSSVFFTLAGFTVIYFITAAFFMPETKGRTLEEIEKYFTTGKMPE